MSFFRIWVCIELKIQILVWIYYGCLESTKELLRLPLTTTGRAERRKKGNPNSWGTLVRGLKTNLPSSSTVENLHSYSLKPVMILSNSRNVLTSRLLHKICINLVFDIGLLFLRTVFFFMAQTWWIIDAHNIAIKQLFSRVIFGFISFKITNKVNLYNIKVFTSWTWLVKECGAVLWLCFGLVHFGLWFFASTILL